MGRKKQLRPHRSGPLILPGGVENNEAEHASTITRRRIQKNAISSETQQLQPFFVEADPSCWVSDEHLDISEILLTQLNISQPFSGYQVTQDFYQNSKYSIRFCVRNINDSLARIKLGHWPSIPATDISLELIEKCTSVDKGETHSVILSGSFDGPDEALSSLIHLASLKFVTLRPPLGVVAVSGDNPTMRLRVQMLRSAFDACESLLDNARQLWKKSLMNVMAWLRPEVTTSEARYRFSKLTEMETNNLRTETGEGSSIPTKRARFDAATFYEAIKPSKGDPMLEDDIPELLPQLRPYQRRAAYWMVQREKGDLGSSDRKGNSQFLSPLCVPVDFADTSSQIFYNPFSGNVSMHPELPPPFISGGVLADEMGLGKTVELLACIFGNQKSASTYDDELLQANGNNKHTIRRLKKERVECICGAVTESYRFKGLWVQCDICDAWQHADCVGYSARGKSRAIQNGQKNTRKKNSTNIIMRDGEHVCQPCSELIQATDSPVPTGATLIVCPAPILSQWHSEITRHTKPGALKVCIYEGVRNTSEDAYAVMSISELLNYDVVLTTYDVLRDDLSHDSDRHEGDRRTMRFQKRYPVIPTLLTRIYWWRICLDEAQMVEGNAGAATEMALRLYTKNRWCITGTPIQRRLDDLYGLLRFLKATPFDISRWWIDVIRDPYERRDVAAMEFTHRFFKQIMWRSSKTHVADELQLPPQEECVSWLSFSPIEEHFYQRQHETCVSYAREVIQSMKDDILKRESSGCLNTNASSDPFITQAEAAKLLNSLLKLRQACCHPQVGSSGLRSLQQSPMTMEEILLVLIGKTKIEGEEVLRQLVVALNALAAVAIIEEKLPEAVLLYKEALALAAEHSEDFRLDPLLNIHILHNLAEILPAASSYSQEPHTEGHQDPQSSEKVFKRHSDEECDQHVAKRRRVSLENGSNQSESQASNDTCLTAECEILKQKYLSAFNSKLSLVQQDFRKSYTQVCDALREKKEQDNGWWVEVLDYVEQSTDSSNELIRKVGEAVSSTLNNSRSSKIAPSFQSITALKYHIQTRMDLLETSRQKLVDRILEIDQTMDKPREEDISRVRYCPVCQVDGDGPTCVHCELDELFQAYEARLFRLNKAHGGVINSAEEAVDLQKKNFALNRFLRDLSQPNKDPSLSMVTDEEAMKKRDVADKVVVSKSPSELEVVLGVIKNYCKAQFGISSKSAATKQLLLLEGMRKEYAHARSLAIAQAQVLRAHDEIKMATSRLRLKEDDNDKSIDALGLEELVPTNAHYSSEKFVSLTLLSHTKGKLRYLKGLVQSKQKLPADGQNSSSLAQETGGVLPCPTEQENACLHKANEEACPVCQEKLSNQKMVFSCGHVTCCKCFFAMTERRISNVGKSQDRWVMCPTCRQHTDFGNIAFADDGQNSSATQYKFQGLEKYEASITVKGSYGTKIEAITRRILWIKSTDPKAKVLVFSSWNDVLDVLGHAFAANDITHIRMKGGRKSQIAINKFRSGEEGNSKMCGKQLESKSIQVLLLLIQHGANGLNLLEAQHVVLVEPLLNPAAEAQAISRVHRIGQENRTLVHRFMISGSVEEGIYKLNRSKNTSSFISGNKKNQDEAVLTLRDIESLFASVHSTVAEKPSESLVHLPPSMAAAIAAERRLNQSVTITEE